MATYNLPTVPVDGGLSRYFREVMTFPILSKEDEVSLALRLRETQDFEAAHQLVTSHLRLVAKIAMKYRGYGLPVSDLVSEGNIGLMKAVKKFDPDLGFRLSTYAMWWIKASITEYVLKSWSMVRMGTVASQKKLFFSLRKLKKNLKITDSGELEPESVKLIAEAVKLPEQDVINMNRRLSSRDLSLNAPMRSDDEAMEFQDSLVDERASPEAAYADVEEHLHHQKILNLAVEELPERERHIFKERKLRDDPLTLEELGKVYSISRERVRQLEARAFEKVKSFVMTSALAENQA